MTATDTAPHDSTGHHYAALDGLRGVAVLLVFCVHAGGNAAAVVLGADFDRIAVRVAHDDWRTLAVLAVRVASRRFPVFRAVRIPDRPHVVAAPGHALHDVRVAPHAAHLSRVPARLRRVAGLRLRVGHLAAARCAAARGQRVVPERRARALCRGLQRRHLVAVLRDDVLPRVPGVRAAGAVGRSARRVVAVASAGSRCPWSPRNSAPTRWCCAGRCCSSASRSRCTSVACARSPRRLPTLAVVLAYLAVTSLALVDVLTGAARDPVLRRRGGPRAREESGAGQCGVLASYSQGLARARPDQLFVLSRALDARGAGGARGRLARRRKLGPVAATLAIFGGGFVASAAVATALWWIAERPYFAWVRRLRQ